LKFFNPWYGARESGFVSWPSDLELVCVALASHCENKRAV